MHGIAITQVNSSGKVRRASDYKFFTEFQSHEAEFDYLKSLEIEEKINAIKWCPRANGALFLLSTNGESPAIGYIFLSSPITGLLQVYYDCDIHPAVSCQYMHKQQFSRACLGGVAFRSHRL